MKEENLGYFRPGFYPIKSRSIVPAMICLTEIPLTKEPDVQFILIKPDCYLDEWQDALAVSENDFDQVMANCQESINTTEKIETLIKAFSAKGYLFLSRRKENHIPSDMH